MILMCKSERFYNLYNVEISNILSYCPFLLFTQGPFNKILRLHEDAVNTYKTFLIVVLSHQENTYVIQFMVILPQHTLSEKILLDLQFFPSTILWHRPLCSVPQPYNPVEDLIDCVLRHENRTML